jgi:Copper type II ascorbate-dependent monooxygenase, C-terminal domain
MRLLLLPLLLAACAEPAGDTGAAAVDLRRDFPAAPEGGLQFVTPEYTISPYSEEMWCTFLTYDDVTVGLHAQYTYQSDMGHHIVVNATNADPDEYPDGSVRECTQTSDLPMTDMDPLMVGGVLGTEENEHEGALELPDGMAARMSSGTRLLLQSHYVNTTADPILVQDAVNFDLIAEDDVETWAAAFVHLETSHPIPAQSDHGINFTCPWEEEELNILFLGGHMHEWGRAFRTDMTRDGKTSTIYEVAEWDPVYRDAPPYDYYDPGEFPVRSGDSFTTYCEWTNDTDEVIDFPGEMCVTFGMLYPYKVPIVCDPD